VKDPKDEQDQEVVNFRLETKLIVPIVPICSQLVVTLSNQVEVIQHLDTHKLAPFL